MLVHHKVTISSTSLVPIKLLGEERGTLIIITITVNNVKYDKNAKKEKEKEVWLQRIKDPKNNAKLPNRKERH